MPAGNVNNTQLRPARWTYWWRNYAAHVFGVVSHGSLPSGLVYMVTSSSGTSLGQGATMAHFLPSSCSTVPKIKTCVSFPSLSFLEPAAQVKTNCLSIVTCLALSRMVQTFRVNSVQVQCACIPRLGRSKWEFPELALCEHKR